MTESILGDHAEFVRGVTFKPADVVDVGAPGSLVCLRTKNVQAVLDETDLIAIPDDLVRNDAKKVRRGDLLVSSANSWNLVGKCCRVLELQYPSVAGGFISILRATTGALDPDYLYHWFNSGRIQATVRSFGNQTTNISNLNHRRVLKLEIPLPPLAEQKRIAAILDAADGLRAKRREALAQLDTLLQSTFLDMFGDPVTNPMGWEIQHIEDLVSPKRPVTYGILKPGPDLEEGTPYVRVVDIRGEEVLVNQLRRTSSAIAAKYKRSTLMPGDLLMSIRGHVGRMAVVPKEAAGANITQDAARLAFSGAEAPYVMRVLSTPGMRQYMARRTKGAAVKGINLADVRRIPIPVPPVSRQRAFTTFAASVVENRRVQTSHLAELDTLFASLQQRAFRGDL